MSSRSQCPAGGAVVLGTAVVVAAVVVDAGVIFARRRIGYGTEPAGATLPPAILAL